MQQVAERAGVSKASLYLRWPNKIALAAQAMQHRANVVPDPPDTGSLATDMHAFLRALMRGRHRGSQALAPVGGETASHPDLRDAFRAGITGRLLDSLRTIVTRAVTRGELPANTDVDLLTLLPVAILQHWRMISDQKPSQALLDRLVAQFYTP
jgi:AcrR family transcriptional regulator